MAQPSQLSLVKKLKAHLAVDMIDVQTCKRDLIDLVDYYPALLKIEKVRGLGLPLMHHILQQCHDQTIALELIEPLLTRSIDLELQNSYGETTLFNCFSRAYYAHKTPPFDVITRLIEHGASPIACDLYGLSLFHLAPDARALDYLQTLELDVNAQDLAQRTPLMLAIEAPFENLDLVTQLIDRGADPSIVRFDGQTAIEMAQSNGYTKIADFLRGRELAMAEKLALEEKTVFLLDSSSSSSPAQQASRKRSL